MARHPRHDDEQERDRGLMATAVLGATAEIVARQRERIVSRMIAGYRSRTITHDDLVGAAAELKALDDFISDCETDQTRGNVATQRMHSDAP